MITIGIDPDADKHGIAIFHGVKLVALHGWRIMDVINFIEDNRDKEIQFSIEDVMANKFIYARNVKQSKTLQSKIAMSIGRCQQSQVELMRILDHYKIQYKCWKPTKANWAKDKRQFERITGWNSRSNEDTRSAAYFGFMIAI